MFSMAVGTIGEWLKLVPFFLLGYVQLIRGGGGGGGEFLWGKNFFFRSFAGYNIYFHPTSAKTNYFKKWPI